MVNEETYKVSGYQCDKNTNIIAHIFLGLKDLLLFDHMEHFHYLYIMSKDESLKHLLDKKDEALAIIGRWKKNWPTFGVILELS